MLDHIPAANNLEGSGLTDEFVGLKKLSLNGVGLTTLKHLPVLSSLRKVSHLFTFGCLIHSWSLVKTDSHLRLSWRDWSLAAKILRI